MRQLLLSILFILGAFPLYAQSWHADNGNGTYTNPLFYEEFSDPCVIRVGNDYYMTGTTMHMMPGLPILHSKDLVNWKLISYVFNRFDLGDECKLENGKEMYGQGIWAPSFVYHNGKFYIFANVNGRKTQCYQSDSPYGPWKHWEMKSSFHDLSVFFDTDGKRYVTYGCPDNYLGELNEDMTDTIPGTTKIIAHSRGEGAHMYKIKDEYLIVWAVPGSTTPQLAGKAKNIYGPYEIKTISYQNHMSVPCKYRLKESPWKGYASFKITEPNLEQGLTLHQGGIIDTPTGEWWGLSMQDYNSLGRVTNLTPITWKDGFPYFGLEGNLTKTPKIWKKPDVGLPQQPITSLADRNDDFSSDKLKLIWQWNHLPDDAFWSLIEKRGKLRLHSLPAKDFWFARNTLTQRCIGMKTSCSVDVDASHIKKGDITGLALLNYPYALIAITKETNGYYINMYDQSTNHFSTICVHSPYVRFSVDTDFETEKARFFYSVGNDTTRHSLGDYFTMVFQVKTFQGVRYSLFNYNALGNKGGFVDFDNFKIHEEYYRGLRKPIPYEKNITMTEVISKQPLTIEGFNTFYVCDMSLGRIALKTPEGFVSVNDNGGISLVPKAGINETFQWIELETGELVLLSLKTHKYLQTGNGNASLNALKDVPSPDRRDGTRFTFK